MPEWLGELMPIAMLLGLVVLIVARLPKVEIGHSPAFLRRRFLNWFPLGMTYAFLYMGRYNLTAAKDAGAITGEQFGDIFGAGAMIYGLSFFLNGPLADRYGGRKTILVAAAGSAVMNGIMGLVIANRTDETNIVVVMSVLYALNMYFQSFGAVSIVKVNAAWFHVRERGVFGGIFGILISLGIYFAFDWGHMIVEALPVQWVFFIPSAILAVFFAIDFFAVRATPGGAGLKDFDTGDASSGEDDTPDPVLDVVKRMFSNPIIVTIALVEFCSGFLRNAIMHWYRDFAKGMELTDGYFVYEHWGMLLCMAGIVGGMFAGVISDRVFQSRRGPVAAVLYGLMLLGAGAVVVLLQVPQYVGVVVIFMSMAIIGVHGMLSGTASMDFGGKKNAGIAVGLIDGFVYFGTFFQSVLLGRILPEKGTPEAADIDAWISWPLAMMPVALIGMLLAMRLWNAKPKPRVQSADEEAA